MFDTSIPNGRDESVNLGQEKKFELHTCFVLVDWARYNYAEEFLDRQFSRLHA